MGRKSHKEISRRLLTETGIEKLSLNKPVSSYRKLPDEIFHTILVACARDRLLSEAMRVCRKWNVIGTPLLFTHLNLVSPRTLLALQRSIRLSPRLADQIKSITLLANFSDIFAHYSHSMRKQRAAQYRSYAAALQGLTALQSVSITTLPHHKFVSLLIRALPQSVQYFELVFNDRRSGLECGHAYSIEHPQEHICVCLAQRMTQFKALQLRGAPFCSQLFNAIPEGSEGCVDLTIDLINAEDWNLHGLDELAQSLCMNSVAAARCRDAHSPFKQVKIISFKQTISLTDERAFDSVVVRYALEYNATISPARIMRPRNSQPPIFLRIAPLRDMSATDLLLRYHHEDFAQYYAETWEQVAALHNDGVWCEEVHLGFRLPPPAVLGNVGETSWLEWPHPAVMSTLRESKVLTMLQTMHEELFQFENAAQRPLLLPETHTYHFPNMTRQTCTQEQDGTYKPDGLWMPDSLYDDDVPSYIVDHVWRRRTGNVY